VASFVGLHNKVLLGQIDLTGSTRSVTFGDLTRAMQDCSTFADGGFTCYKPGLISGMSTIEGNQNFDTGSVDDSFSVDELGSQYVLTVIPNPTGTSAVGDTAWFTRGVEAKVNPLGGAKGEMASFTLEVAHDTAAIRGVVAHLGTAVTTSASDSGIALTGPTSAQRLYAGLHVTAYTGFTNVVVTVQSDDNANFTSATDRITFTTVTGLTSQFTSVAGDFSTETRHRISYVATGAGSITFTAVIGVI
jgi:hypothetical protein